MLGGVLVPATLSLYNVAPQYFGLAVVVPVLLGFGLIEIYGSDGEAYGSGGKAGLILTSIGLSLLLVAFLAYAVFPPAFVLTFILAVPVLAGSVSLALGSGLLAISLRRTGRISQSATVLLGLGVPAAPVLGAVLSALFGPTLPAAVQATIVGIPYGAGWILTASQLRTRGGRDVSQSSSRGGWTTVSPHSLGTGTVGGALVLLSVGRFLPLGPLSGTPWVGESLILDICHLLVGIFGLVVAILIGSERVRDYERIVGIGSFLLVGLTLFGTFLGIPGLRWLAASFLALNLLDIILYLPVGLILVTLGFGVGVDES